MRIAPVPIGARLIDTTKMLSPVDLRSLSESHVDGIIAYLGGNLTANLIANALSLRIGIVPVNYSRAEGWIPTAELGVADAKASVARLTALGIPTEGLVDWCDLEGCGADPTAYLHEWGNVVEDKGRLGGLYVGAGGLLSAVQLYALPKITRYWQSESRSIPEPVCGFVLKQLYPTTSVGDIAVDYDYAQHDFLGRAATWICADAQA